MQGTQIESENSPACYDYEDFFRRTRYTIEDRIIDDGQLMSFQNDLVVRYLEKVIVNDDGYDVKFKAEVNTRTPLDKKK